LIELLVVIAIIGILAAMVFPVFARARESARRAVCLSNIKNIGLAMQMYLADYDDTMPPNEHRPEIVSWYLDWAISMNGDDDWVAGCAFKRGAANNPYLKWQVVLDPYVRNRDVWRCPSQRTYSGNAVLFPIDGWDWWSRVLQIVGEAGQCTAGMACGEPFPPGWGGDITDSYVQGQCLPGTGGIAIGISGVHPNYDLKLAHVDDAARWIAVAEMGPAYSPESIVEVAYPDWCRIGCSSCEWGPAADWEGCPWSQDCGAGSRDFADGAWRQRNAARHLGGANIGFLDGHAKWWNSEAILSAVPDWRWFRAETRTDFPIAGPYGMCRIPEYGDPTYYIQ